MPHVIMAGNLTIDELVFPDGRHEIRQCGGNCLYAAVGAAIWGPSVGILSVAGTDYPREWLDRVRDAGLDIEGIAAMAIPHGMAAGLAYNAAGERTIWEHGQAGRSEYNRHPHEWEEWLIHSPRPAQIPKPYLAADGLHLAPMPVQAHEGLVQALRPHMRCLTLDAPWWDGATGRTDPHLDLLASLDALLPSEAEVRAFYGTDIDPADAARRLGRLGSKAVVVKIGGRGAWVYTPRTDQLLHVPAYPCQVVDPTGAGDSFCGGFLVGLVETGDPVQAARYGTVSASFVIEGFGALYALGVTRRQAETRLATLTAFTS